MLRMTAPASGSDKCELPVNGKVDWQFAFIQGAIVYKRLLPRLEGLSPLDAGAGLAGDRSDAGVGGQVGRAFEVGDVAADAEQDAACGPDACPGRLWHPVHV